MLYFNNKRLVNVISGLLVVSVMSLQLSALKYEYGSATQQGKLTNPVHEMEDRVSIVQDEKSATHFFAVYDGHFGTRVVDHVDKHLAKYLFGYLNGYAPTEAISYAVIYLDKYIKGLEIKNGGTCASMALIIEDIAYVANVGDCRTILINQVNQEQSIIPLSRDHTCEDPAEYARVIKAGGNIVECNTGKKVVKVIKPGRLPFTRVIGDHNFKQYAQAAGLIADPEIQERQLVAGDMIIIASDGLWDFVSNEQAAQIVQQAKNAQIAAELLKQEVLFTATREDVDDIAVIVIRTHED